jgi:cytochrome c oxidase subunit I
VDFLIFALHISGVRSILSRLNFLTTLLCLRRSTVPLECLRLFCWSLGVASFLLLLRVPVLACALRMILFDRHLGTSFFDYEGGGGSLLYQHLFWFFGHPEVYVLILPVFGIMRRSVLALSGGFKIVGHHAVVCSLLLIGVIGSFV